ncbi:MAG: thiamine diphosphokinase [Paracoccaceae bacterium]
MIDEIVQHTDIVTMVGGGPAKTEDLLNVLAYSPFLVAADGGAVLADRAGLVPDAVIGDFDSIPKQLLDKLPQDCLHRIAEQDSTDFEKALSNVAAPLVLAVGFTGARTDHQLAVFHTLVLHPNRPCIVIGAQDVVCLAPPVLSLDLVVGDTVSLFPMGPVSGHSEGLRWPIDGLNFSPDQKIGTSNEATGPVRLRFDAPKMLLVLPRHAIPLLVQHWMQAPLLWPAL